MAAKRFVLDLERYGPQRSSTIHHTLDSSLAYCRHLARSHYENFTVASWFLPRQLRQHFYNIYAYCRWADDLADETDDRSQSLNLLDWWWDQVDQCYRGQADHPVFIALAETVRQFEIPDVPFKDLLVAFRRDQRQTRYMTFEDLLDYCRYSANPVGQLVLYLGRCHDLQNVELSDSICTGLQLANFCQDVGRDFDRGRIYLPQESCRRFRYGEEMFSQRLCNDCFRELLAFEVQRAESYLTAGWPLVKRVSRPLRFDMELFIRGGLAILQAIRLQHYDVWSRRPTLGRWTKFRLMWSTWRGLPVPVDDPARRPPRRLMAGF